MVLTPVGWIPRHWFTSNRTRESDQKELEHPGFKAAADLLNEHIRKEDNNEGKKYIYDPALREARKVGLKHFIGPVFVPCFGATLTIARSQKNLRLRLLVTLIIVTIGTYQFIQEEKRYDKKVERAAIVLTMNTPLADELREEMLKYDNEHWTILEYKRLMREEREAEMAEIRRRASTKRRRFLKERWMDWRKESRRALPAKVARLSNPHSDSRGVSGQDILFMGEHTMRKQWMTSRWKGDYVPINPDIHLLPEMKKKMHKVQEQVVEDFERIRDEIGESEASNLSIGEIVTRDTSRFIEEFPLPNDEFKYATERVNSASDDSESLEAGMNMIQSNNNDDDESHTNYSLNSEDDSKTYVTGEYPAQYDQFRPTKAMLHSDYYPKPLIETQENQLESDYAFLDEFGVVDDDFREFLLQKAEPAEIFEDCWKIEDDYRRCRLKHAFNRPPCAEFKARAKRCRALVYMARLKGAVQ